ncbi:MAG: hypothetical protein K1X81_00815 [Bacteroidia bacterium]|nr:hypothetical protein [Bacteroidia bacterium]
MKKAISILSIVVTLLSCKTPQHYSIDKLPSHQLYFGSGGGFAAAWNEYLLLDNGQLFYFNSLTKEKKELKSIEKKEAKNIYKKLAQLNLNSYQLNKTGNMTYYIREVNNNTSHEVKWAIEQSDVPSEIKSFYQLLQSKVSNHE